MINDHITYHISFHTIKTTYKLIFTSTMYLCAQYILATAENCIITVLSKANISFRNGAKQLSVCWSVHGRAVAKGIFLFLCWRNEDADGFIYLFFSPPTDLASMGVLLHPLMYSAHTRKLIGRRRWRWVWKVPEWLIRPDYVWVHLFDYRGQDRLWDCFWIFFSCTAFWSQIAHLGYCLKRLLIATPRQIIGIIIEP